MADLIAIAFDEQHRAAEVRDQLLAMQRAHLVDLEDAAVVERKESGRVRLRQSIDLTAQGALGGAFWGTLIGLLFLNPLLGMGVGLASGAVAGALADVGIDDAFMKDLGRSLPEGSSALFVLVRRATYDKVLAELAPFDGRIIRTSLSEDQEARLRGLIREHAAGAA